MSVREDQITALGQARSKIAAVREERQARVEECRRGIEAIDLALQRLENRLRLLAIPRADLEKFAQSLSSAYLDSKMPDSIMAELVQKTNQIGQYDAEMKETSEAVSQLTKTRGDLDVNYRLAKDALAKIEAELAQVDRKIADIRGF